METDEELLERYRSNNYDLALALNDLKIELMTLNRRLLAKEGDFQTIYAENAHLKKELAQRDQQLNTWRVMFMELVQANTRKFNEVMQKVGLVPASNSNNNNNNVVNNTDSSQLIRKKKAIDDSSTPLTTKKVAKTERLNDMRRRRFSLDESPNNRLANLSEESTNSEMFDSVKFSPTTESSNSIGQVPVRRRASVPPVSPVSSPPKKDKPKKTKKIDNKPMLKIAEITDENTPQNINGRPSRRTAPKNLAEPKLTTKLRRDC